MADTAIRTVAGSISLDKFGERLFLVVNPGMRVRFGDQVITGGQELRIIGGDTNFENEIGVNQSQRVSVAARLATSEELEGRAPSQLTDPTLTATKIVRFEAIQKLAFEIFGSEGGTAESNWLSAELELLTSPSLTTAVAPS
jgi:hypothetical protein